MRSPPYPVMLLLPPSVVAEHLMSALDHLELGIFILECVSIRSKHRGTEAVANVQALINL